MIDNIAYRIILKLRNKNVIEENDQEIYLYGFQLFFSTIIKVLGLLVIAGILGFIKETIVFILYFSSLRIQAGGIHANSYLKCFVVTLIFTYISILISLSIPYNYALEIQLVAIVISILLVYQYAPVETENKPLCKKEVLIYRRKSMITVVAGSTIILILTFFKNPEVIQLGNIASMGFLTEAITLTPLVQSKIIKKRGGVTNEKEKYIF